MPPKVQDQTNDQQSTVIHSEEDLQQEVDQQTQVDSESQQIQQTNDQQDRVTDIKDHPYVKLLEEQTRTDRQTIQNLTSKPDVTVTAEERVDPEAEKAAFYTDPVSVIRREIATAVAPLMELAKTFRGNTVLEGIERKFKVHPTFGKYMGDPDILEFVRGAMSHPSITMDEQTYQSALVQAIGLKGIGALGTSVETVEANQNQNVSNQNQNQNNQSGETRTTMQPAHMRPSNPVNTQQQGQNKKPILTELQKRLARENNMTDVEYLAWLDEPASNVVESTIGKSQGK